MSNKIKFLGNLITTVMDLIAFRSFHLIISEHFNYSVPISAVHIENILFLIVYMG